MTILSQIQTTLRALAEIPAVVKLARDANLMRRTHVETALRLQLAKKQAHIERLQYRCSKAGADVAKALRDVAKWRDKFHAAEVRAGEEIAKTIKPNGEPGTWQEMVEDLRNELGSAKSLIFELKRQLADERLLSSVQSEALTKLQQESGARIRELETQAERHRGEQEVWRSKTLIPKQKTMADMWRKVGDEEWLDRNGKYLLLCDGRGTFSVRAGAAVTSVGTIWSSYIVLEPPR